MRRFIIIFITATLWPGLSMAGLLQSDAPQAYVLDYNTNSVLLNKNGEEEMTPSSMTKLMTLYMMFDALKRGDISLDDSFLVSEKAWKKGGSKMFVEVGKRVRVQDLIRGIIVQSGNDACIVVAENMAGSEADFALQMNEMGAQIGLERSHFKNATGWPDEGHVMSAKDIATLSAALIRDFPEFYPYFAETEFTYANITQPNRNNLLYRNVGADGLKTGHTEKGGYGLASSAIKDGRRLVVVVNGLDSMKARIDESERLIRRAYASTKHHKLATAYAGITSVPVYKGKHAEVLVGAAADVQATLAKTAKPSLQLRYNAPLVAPIEKGQEIGIIEVLHEGQLVQSMPAIALEEVKKQSLIGQFFSFPARFIRAGEAE